LQQFLKRHRSSHSWTVVFGGGSISLTNIGAAESGKGSNSLDR